MLGINQVTELRNALDTGDFSVQDYETIINLPDSGISPDVLDQLRGVVEVYKKDKMGFVGSADSFQPISFDDRKDAVRDIENLGFIRRAEAGIQEPMRVDTPVGRINNPAYFDKFKDRANTFLLDSLSKALNKPTDQIDIFSGLDSLGQRALLSFQQEPEDKKSFLAKRYGDDNVKQFKIGNKDSFLININGVETLVDERGFALGDLTDLSRDALTLGAEVVGGTIATGGPGGVQALARPVLRAGMGAGTGRLASELVAETVEASTGDTADFQIGAPFGRAAVTAATDTAAGKLFQMAGRVLSAPGMPSESVTEQKFYEALKRIQDKTQRNIPLTPSQQAGRAQALRETEVAAQVLRETKRAVSQPPVVRQREAVNKSIEELINIMEGGSGNFDEVVQVVLRNIDSLGAEADSLMVKAGNLARRVVQKRYDNMAETVLSNTTRQNIAEVGEEAVSTVRQAARTVEAEKDRLYNLVDELADDIPPTDMLDIAKGMIKSLDNLKDDIPAMDDGAKAIAAFIPKPVIEQLIKSKALKGPAAARLRKIKEYQKLSQEGDQMLMFAMFEGIADPGEPLKVSFKQLLNVKKQAGRAYGQTQRGDYLDRKALGNVLEYLDGALEKMAKDADSGAFDALKEANEFFITRQLPIYEDRFIQQVLSGGQIDNAAVAQVLFDPGRRRITRLELIKKSLATNPEAFQEFNNKVKSMILSRLFDATESQGTGMVDIKKLNQLLDSRNREFLEKFFGKRQIKELQKLTNYAKQTRGLSPDGAFVRSESVPQKIIQDILDLPESAFTPLATERAALQETFNAALAGQRRYESLIKNQVVKIIRDGGDLASLDINHIMLTLLDQKSAVKTKEFMDLIDDPIVKEHVKARYRSFIFNAARGKLPQMDRMQLPDADSKYFMELLDSSSRLNKTAKAVLGEEGFEDVVAMIRILDRVGQTSEAATTGLLRQDSLQFIGRGGQAQRTVMPRVILGFDFGALYNKFLGVALGNEAFVKALNRSDASDELLGYMIPFIVSSDKPLEVLLRESAIDPRVLLQIEKSVNQEAADSDLLR